MCGGVAGGDVAGGDVAGGDVAGGDVVVGGPLAGVEKTGCIPVLQHEQSTCKAGRDTTTYCFMSRGQRYYYLLLHE